MDNNISNNSLDSVTIIYDDGHNKQINKSDLKNFGAENISKISAQSIVRSIDLFNPTCLISTFVSDRYDRARYEVNNIEYYDTDKVATYINQLKAEKEEIYNRFLDADVLYICFLGNDFVKKISSDKNLFNRVKNGLLAKIRDNKHSNAIGDFMQYIRLRYDYDNKSRCMYVNLALEVLESLNLDSLIEEIDKNGKKVTRFKDRECKNFLFYLLDIINISGIECLNLFAKKYVDNKSNLQQLIGFILKLYDGSITKNSCLGALFLIFPQMATTIYKPDLSEQDHDLYTQCLINFINSDEVVLSVLTNRDYKNEDKECVAKFLVDKIKCNKIKDAVSNLKDRKVIERVWRFIQKYYGNKNENNYLELVDEFAKELIKKDETSALISVPAVFFDRRKLDDTTKNLILKTKDLGKIIELIGNVKYETAKLFLDFIFSTELGVKENFEDELCKTSFTQDENSNLMNYFRENMNLPKCRNILKKLAQNKDGKYKDGAGNLIDCFYDYLIRGQKIPKQGIYDYFINLINEEKNIIKFIRDMDFCVDNIDNEIVKENFPNAPIKYIDMTLSRIADDIKHFDNLEDKQLDKEQFVRKMGFYVYELMMRPDIFEILPVAKYKQNGALEPNQEIIGTEIWYIFTETLKSKIKNNDLNEAECKNISNEKWFSHVFAKMLDSVEKLRTEMEETEYDWRKNEIQKELSRLVPILCNFVSAILQVKRNKDELYDIIWDKIEYIPYDFFLQQIPNGNFSLRNIIFHKAKLSQKDKDDILEKTKSAYKTEIDEQGKEKLVFNQNLSEEEVNIIKKKTGHEYVVTLKDGKEEIVFNTDENGKLVKKEYKSDPQSFWFWRDIQDFLEQREIWKRKWKCYRESRVIGTEYAFLFDLEDLSEIIATEKDDYKCMKWRLLSYLNDKFEGTHQGFFECFKKQPKDNLTMADWLIYRLEYSSESVKDDFCCNLINLIYKDFDKYVQKKKGSNTKYQLINKFMNRISEKYLRKNLFSTKNNTLKNIISDASKKKDTLFFKLGMPCLNKLKYDTQNNNEQQNFLNLFSLYPSEIINHIDVNFILDNLDNNCVWENLKFLPEKCPHKNYDGIENENHKKIRLICENKNFNSLGKLQNRHRSNSVKISSKNNKSYESKAKLWKEDEPKNVINEDKNFDRICKTQEEYWLKLIEFGPKDIIGYLDWNFIYRNLDKKLIQDHLKYINWSIVFNEDNSLEKIMKFIAQEEKFYTQDMEQNLNNIFWQNFKHVKDNPISNYKFLFLLNIYPQTIANMDISFLADNLLALEEEFVKTNLNKIGGQDRIKNLCEYIEKNEAIKKNKEAKLVLLLDSSIGKDCVKYINLSLDFVVNNFKLNVIKQIYLRNCSKETGLSIYKAIAESNLDIGEKTKKLLKLVRWIDMKVLDYIVEKGLIEKDIINIFSRDRYGNKEFYRTNKGKLMWHDGSSREVGARIIKQVLEKLETQKKNSNNNNQNLEIENNNENMIKNDPKNQIVKNITHENDNSTDAIQYRYQLIINNNDDHGNKSNVPPNNKKTRICLVIVGLIFIIVGICLLPTAPKITIIFLVIGGLLFIGAIGFNKFRSCLCFNKSQIENSEFEQKQQSIDERTDNLQAEQMPGNNEINNNNPLEHN